MKTSQYTPLHLTILLLAVLVLASCIRKEYEDCPSLQVSVVVKDKNYFNVSKVDLEEARSESMDFCQYVPTLSYTLRSLSTHQVVAQQELFAVPQGLKQYDITFDSDLPWGQYELTVWGGTDTDDPYLVTDTINYTYSNSRQVVEMERIKGKLIVQAWHMPNTAEYSLNTIDHLRTETDAYFRYSGNESLTVQADWSEHLDDMVWKQVLYPSTGELESNFYLVLHDADDQPLAQWQPKKVNLTMERNYLTVLRYVWAWNPDINDYECTIYMLVNDNWEVYHEMIID